MSMARRLAWRALHSAKASIEALARAADRRSSHLSLMRRYAEAGLFARGALVLSGMRFGRHHSVTAVMLRKLAKVHEARRRPSEAEPLYRRALEIWERRLGPEHPEFANALHDLAELCRAEGREWEAVPLLHRARRIWDAAIASPQESWGRYGETQPLNDGSTCPTCMGDLIAEKDSMSGREIRSYYCPFCGWTKDEDRGPALWAVLSGDPK